MHELEGKVAAITGGASGIGLALAHRLAAERTRLALIDVEAAALEVAERELRAAGAEVLAIRADVSRSADVEAAAARVRDVFGMAHIVVNNAGVGGGGGPLWAVSEDDWRWTIDVNLWGVIHGIRAFVPALLASGEEGHVVNTASIAGVITTPWLGAYTATKHAVVAISEVLAKDLELAGARVGVSVLCPGFVQTRIATSHRNRPAEPDRADAEGAGAAAKLGAMFEQLVAAGKPASEIADHVVAAIRTRRFWVFTHPEMASQIEHRLRDVTEQRQPGIDPTFRQLLSAK
jgi:NAD(P)-dependent dehydrogenase (short-subunit alcohol dehydrogenase family)